MLEIYCSILYLICAKDMVCTFSHKMKHMLLTSIFLCASISGSYAFFKDVMKLIPDAVNPLNLLHTNRCIEDLGCFYTGGNFFHPLLRPISLPPTYDVKTKFHLYTRQQPNESYPLEATKKSVQSSTFDSSRETKFLIHGFLTDLAPEDLRFQMKDALLVHNDYNIIIVDWTANNRFPYSQAVANARMTGANTAKLINFLIKNTGMRPQDVHLIGHSLGGQISGYIGERVENLGRITGLDPAGPYFNEMDKEVRLDETDALFVDVIHTDSNKYRGLGYLEPVGHMDFYPNGGYHQLGCVSNPSDTPIVGTVFNYTIDFVASTCDHERANIYFLESIENHNCKFEAVLCDNLEDYEKHVCDPKNSTVSEMGFFAKRRPGLTTPAKFFLRTNTSSPFCIGEKSIYL